MDASHLLAVTPQIRVRVPDGKVGPKEDSYDEKHRVQQQRDRGRRVVSRVHSNLGCHRPGDQKTEQRRSTNATDAPHHVRERKEWDE